MAYKQFGVVVEVPPILGGYVGAPRICVELQIAAEMQRLVLS